jgi:hypothetical protein
MKWHKIPFCQHVGIFYFFYSLFSDTAQEIWSDLRAEPKEFNAAWEKQPQKEQVHVFVTERGTV